MERSVPVSRYGREGLPSDGLTTSIAALVTNVVRNGQSVHCDGLPGYLQIVAEFEGNGWRCDQFWSHSGHLFCQHVVKALGLGGAEITPFSFRPFGGLADGQGIDGDGLRPPELPGISFESKTDLARLFVSLT